MDIKDLKDLGFANITPVDGLGSVSESIKETDRIFEHLAEGKINMKQTVSLIKEKRERLGLPPISISLNKK